MFLLHIFLNCYFDETNFLALGGGNKQLENDITWNTSYLDHLDSFTKKFELEVPKVIHL